MGGLIINGSAIVNSRIEIDIILLKKVRPFIKNSFLWYINMIMLKNIKIIFFISDWIGVILTASPIHPQSSVPGFMEIRYNKYIEKPDNVIIERMDVILIYIWKTIKIPIISSKAIISLETKGTSTQLIIPVSAIFSSKYSKGYSLKNADTIKIVPKTNLNAKTSFWLKINFI